jgi:phosphoribosylanthranilate isomerase
MVRVKICGITNLDDARAAIDAGADALGFNFSEEAKRKDRYIDPREAKNISKAIPPFITKVAVVVDPLPERIVELLPFMDCIQLHGHESVAFCRSIAGKVIKAFRVGEDFNPNAMLDYSVSAFLLDASVPGHAGGTGQLCDWDTARAAVGLGRPVILAGGLNPENVAEAVRTVQPYAVDTASGVESEPGKKDHGKLRDFVERAKSAVLVSG